MEPPDLDQGGEQGTVTTTRLKTRTAVCPLCDAEVRLLGRLLVGEVFGCGKCGAQLEVASPDPVVLEPLARIEEEEEDLDQLL
jgi:lysine biosynthesis protein LysW